MSKRHNRVVRWVLVFGVLAGIVPAAALAADADLGTPVVGTTYTVPYDDGIVELKGGDGTVHLKAWAYAPEGPGDYSGDGTANEVRAVADRLVREASNTRSLYICLGEEVGLDQFTLIECKQYNFGGNESHSRATKYSDPVTCALTGETPFSTIIVAQKANGQSAWDHGATAYLDVSNC